MVTGFIRLNGMTVGVVANRTKVYDEEGNEVESAPHPQQVLYLNLSEKPDQYDLLRVENTKNPEISI